MTDTGTSFTEIGGPDVEALHPQLLELYSACFSGPPWYETGEGVRAYESRIRTWAAIDSFCGLIAHDQTGRLIGTAYGWRGPPETHGVRLPGIADDVVFNVADLMVHPDAQRRGLGRALLRQLVAARRPAALLTHPDSVSRHLYDTAGWRVTGTVGLPDSPLLVVYALD